MNEQQQTEFDKWWEQYYLKNLLWMNNREVETAKCITRDAWEAGVVHMGTFAMEAFKKSLRESSL